MLTNYVDGALRKAKYKILDGNEGYFGEIPGFKGLWANAKSLEDCRDELRSVLESWLLVKLRHNDNDLPDAEALPPLVRNLDVDFSL